MQAFQENKAPQESRPTKPSTRLALLLGVLLIVVWATVLTVQGRYVDAEHGAGAPAESPNATVAIHDQQAQR